MKLISMFHKSAVVGAAFLAWGAVSGAVNAQDQTFTESHLAAAKSVAVATKVLEPFDDILPVMMEQTNTAFIQAEPTRAEEIIEVSQQVALKLAPKRAELNENIYKAWASVFTEEELKQLAEFYSTPLGTKLRDNVPRVTGASVALAKEWQDKLSTEMVTLVQEELTKDASAQ